MCVCFVFGCCNIICIYAIVQCLPSYHKSRSCMYWLMNWLMDGCMELWFCFFGFFLLFWMLFILSFWLNQYTVYRLDLIPPCVLYVFGRRESMHDFSLYQTFVVDWVWRTNYLSQIVTSFCIFCAPSLSSPTVGYCGHRKLRTPLVQEPSWAIKGSFFLSLE